MQMCQLVPRAFAQSKRERFLKIFSFQCQSRVFASTAANQTPNRNMALRCLKPIADYLNKLPSTSLPYFPLLAFGSARAVKNADMLRFRCTSELPEGPERRDLARSDVFLSLRNRRPLLRALDTASRCTSVKLGSLSTSLKRVNAQYSYPRQSPDFSLKLTRASLPFTSPFIRPHRSATAARLSFQTWPYPQRGGESYSASFSSPAFFPTPS
ncbi:hypothetical protein BKA59DRAFT_310601 [Fusarium tricinctum]|uniref:Uncharacterized protein n=1 Tax=Fusarium tricinctum TaxID=61284 RepID=A0A8K0RR37_9HYPO|nr:hypothetical protein BKA59DRAFT_310601 [Fusarium tricinctum]